MTEEKALKIIEELKSKYTDKEVLKMKLYTYALKYSYVGTKYIGEIFMREINKLF